MEQLIELKDYYGDDVDIYLNENNTVVIDFINHNEMHFKKEDLEKLIEGLWKAYKELI